MPTNPNTTELKKPRRRWFQFRLRTLLIGVAVAAILCPLGVRCLKEWEAWQQRRDAERAFAEVRMTWKKVNGGIQPLTEAQIESLRRSFGMDDSRDQKGSPH